MKGTERRAERLVLGVGFDSSDPRWNTAVFAVGTTAEPAHPGAAEVAYHCAHGYGIVFMRATIWRRHDERAAKALLRAVADDHKRRGLVSDVPEFDAVVTL